MSSSAFAQQEQIELFVKANAAYVQEDYSSAIASYREILKSGKISGPLLYNLGNSYFKQGNLGHAVLYYQRALEYIPRDHDLVANSRYALSSTETSEFPSGIPVVARFFSRCFQAVTINELVWLLLILAALLALSHIGGMYLSWSMTRRLTVTIVLFCVTAFCAGGLLRKAEVHEKAAVVLKDVPVLFEPREDATVHFSLFEGNLVDIIKQERSWVKVQREDGKTGWAKSGMIQKIGIED